MIIYSQSLKDFSRKRMEMQGEDIRRWSRDQNPMIAQACREVIEAAQQGEEK